MTNESMPIEILSWGKDPWSRTEPPAVVAYTKVQNAPGICEGLAKAFKGHWFNWKYHSTDMSKSSEMYRYEEYLSRVSPPAVKCNTTVETSDVKEQ